MNSALKTETVLPNDQIDKLEEKVFAAYKTERKKGLEPVKCKATIKVIGTLCREISWHEKYLKDFASVEFKMRRHALKLEQDYKVRRGTAIALHDLFKKMVKYPLLTSHQSKIAIYMFHCKDFAKYLTGATNNTKKLGERAKKDATEAIKWAKITSVQYDYDSRSCYWDDLDDRTS